MNINEILMAIANDLGAFYFRATEDEFNVISADQDLSNSPVINYINQPVGNYEVLNGVKARYDLQIEFIELAKEDDNTIQSETHVSEMRTLAEKFTKLLMNASPYQIPPESFQISSVGMVKKYDDVFTGVLLDYSFTYIVTC